MKFDEWWDTQGFDNEWVKSWARDAWVVGQLQADLEHAEKTPAPEVAAFKRGDKVLVAWESGHLEECTVEEMTVWVKDYTGHAHECTLGQISKITDSSKPQGERP